MRRVLRHIILKPMKVTIHTDKPEYAVAKKVWDDIFNNDTLIYDEFDEYFYHEFYKNQ